MRRPTLAPALALAAAALLHAPPMSRASDDPRFAAEFVRGLRDKGLTDLALEYLDGLRADPATPADLRNRLDYEEGRTLIEAASRSTDPDAGKEMLDRAKVKLDAFVKANPDARETTGALVDLSHLLYERGRTEVDLAGDARNPADKETRLAAARGYYEAARRAYDDSLGRLNAKIAAYPKFIPADDPKWRERDSARGSLMQAELLRNVVDYYDAQTYPPEAKERAELLEKARPVFEDLYKRYRLDMAGFNARMWQGKCYEEQGKLGEAMGIYNELIDHPDGALRALQKQVDYFRIIVMAKRKDYALAADECNRWLSLFPKDRRSFEALGVQLELAKNIIAQLPAISDRDKDRAIRSATEHLAEVVRVISPFKPEALALLQKYRPGAALRAEDVAKMSADEAIAAANQAIQLVEFDKAILLLRAAIRKAGPARDAAKANQARYVLAYAFYMTKRYYDAAVVAEHLARRYPGSEWSGKATEIALNSLIDAYSTYTAGDRSGDLDHILDLADYTARTWSDAEQGDYARMAIGQVCIGMGRYPKATQALEAVRPASSKWIDAQAALADASWKQGLILREKGDAPGADAATARAIEKLKLALKSRKDANAPETDPAYVGNACDLATIDLEVGKPADALALLEPIARKLGASKATAAASGATRVMAGILRAHVATNQVDRAIADMKTLESLGGAGTSAAQLYYQLGKLLAAEVENLKKRNDRAGLKRTEDAYRKFLEALVAIKAGQSFASMRWAADNLLKLGAAKEANAVYADMLKYYGADPDFNKQPDAPAQLARVRVKQVAALLELGDTSQAESMLDDLIAQDKRNLDIQMEKGHLLEAKAERKQATWAAVYAHWKTLAGRLGTMAPKPPEYYESWYQAAVALEKQGKPDLAQKTLANILKLSRDLGGNAEMKAKYQDFAKHLGK